MSILPGKSSIEILTSTCGLSTKLIWHLHPSPQADIIIINNSSPITLSSVVLIFHQTKNWEVSTIVLWNWKVLIWQQLLKCIQHAGQKHNAFNCGFISVLHLGRNIAKRCIKTPRRAKTGSIDNLGPDLVLWTLMGWNIKMIQLISYLGIEFTNIILVTKK